MFKITFYVPLKDKELVKNAMFKAGAGKMGNYDSCAFETEGIGQYRPLAGSNPHLGKLNQIEKVSEVRVEMICHTEEIIKNTISAMKESHPYETVAYAVTKIEDFS